MYNKNSVVSTNIIQQLSSFYIYVLHTVKRCFRLFHIIICFLFDNRLVNYLKSFSSAFSLLFYSLSEFNLKPVQTLRCDIILFLPLEKF